MFTGYQKEKQLLWKVKLREMKTAKIGYRRKEVESVSSWVYGTDNRG
jgi:hypothetical protein